MSRAFNDAVRRAFEIGMKRFPTFNAVKPPREHAWPGERSYRRDAPSLSLWLSLVLSPKGYNEFTLECGWSRLFRYPELAMRPNVTAFDESEFRQLQEGFFRLRSHITGRWQWWSPGAGDELSIEAIRLACAPLNPCDPAQMAAPLVADAINCIADAEPFFLRLLNES
jgi:hypothetical protein